MARDSARSASMKRKCASFARKPASAAYDASHWIIRSTIYTKQNHRSNAAAVSPDIFARQGLRLSFLKEEKELNPSNRQFPRDRVRVASATARCRDRVRRNF